MATTSHLPDAATRPGLLDALRDVVNSERMLTHPVSTERFSRDHAEWAPVGAPAAVVIVDSAAEVQGVVRACHERGVPVVARGAGTGLSGGANAIDGCVVISLERMNRIVEVDTVERLAVVQPGVVNDDLRAHVATSNLWYPPDPASSPWSTIGGNVATNAGGLCCVKYGVTGDYVLALEVVTGTGELVRLGTRTAKGVAGYDLVSLLVGSEGTLGIVTEVTVRLRCLPAPRRTVAAYFDSVVAAGDAVRLVAERGLTPAVFELVDRHCLQAVDAWKNMGLAVDADVVLLAQVDDHGAEGDLATDELLQAFVAGGATWAGRSSDESEADALFAARRLAYPALERLGPVLTEDVCVPKRAVAEMLGRIEAIAARHDILIANIAHVGDGNLHPLLVTRPGDDAARLRAQAAFDDILAEAIDLGGTVTGEHGVGLLKREGLDQELAPAVIEMHRAVKRALDPAGILNPGKVIRDAESDASPPRRRGLRSARKRLAVGLTVASIACGVLAGCGSTVQTVDQQTSGQGSLGALDAAAAAGGSLGTPGTEIGSPAPGAVDPGTGVAGGLPAPSAVPEGQSGTTALPTTAESDVPALVDGTASDGPDGVAADLPLGQGFGYDEKNVWIGVTLSSDGNQAAQAFGLNAIDGGDQVAQAQAMADYYNARGGILGRQVQLRFSDHKASTLTTQAATESQAICEKFTQDEPVVAVINTLTPLDTPALRSCLKAKGLPMFGVSITAIDDQVVQESGGLYIPTLTPTWTRFAPVFVKSLDERKFFTGWNVRTAAPGISPVKVGAFIHDDPVTERAYQELAAASAKAGHPVAEVFRYQDATSAGIPGVLRMASAGVTHVLSLDPGIFIFATAAETQLYRPRYALSTANGPGLLFEANAPRMQSYGALAVGTAPSLDLLGFPGEVTPGGKACRGIMAARDQTFGNGKRFAEAFAFSICDSFRLLADASAAGNGFGANAFLAGVAKAGPKFKTAAAYATGVKPGYPVLPGGARDIAYVKSCSCFRLDGTKVRPL